MLQQVFVIIFVQQDKLYQSLIMKTIRGIVLPKETA